MPCMTMARARKVFPVSSVAKTADRDIWGSHGVGHIACSLRERPTSTKSETIWLQPATIRLVGTDMDYRHFMNLVGISSEVGISLPQIGLISR